MNGLRVLMRLLRSWVVSPLRNADLFFWSSSLRTLVSAFSRAKTLICCEESDQSVRQNGQRGERTGASAPCLNFSTAQACTTLKPMKNAMVIAKLRHTSARRQRMSTGNGTKHLRSLLTSRIVLERSHDVVRARDDGISCRGSRKRADLIRTERSGIFGDTSNVERRDVRSVANEVDPTELVHHSGAEGIAAEG